MTAATRELPLCCVTGRIAGDPHACGDCDPCGAAAAVPESVKRLLKERDEWADKYAGAMMEIDEMSRARSSKDSATPAPDEAPATREGESVQDTWFTDQNLPILAMSGDHESDRVLKLHFRRKVTDADRKRLIAVLNAGETALSTASQLAPRSPLAAEYELATPPHYRPDAADEEYCPPRADAVTREDSPCTCGCAQMLWDWFEHESRIGAEGMRPERHEGLSADDFRTMLDEHEAALLAEPQASWQPIETAPKDGTPILAANSRHEHAAVVVRWDSDDRDGAEPHWCDAATRDGIALYFNPNYFDLWMPAPAVTRPERGGE